MVREITHPTGCCTPKSVGGSNDKANMAKIRRIRHMYVHELMRIYLKPFRDGKSTKNWFIGFDLSQGFTAKQIETLAKQFYRDIDAILGVGVGGC
jgi:hypothetical protein